jgi:hypothetical protein
VMSDHAANTQEFLELYGMYVGCVRTQHELRTVYVVSSGPFWPLFHTLTTGVKRHEKRTKTPTLCQ